MIKIQSIRPSATLIRAARAFHVAAGCVCRNRLWIEDIASPALTRILDSKIRISFGYGPGFADLEVHVIGSVQIFKGSAVDTFVGPTSLVNVVSYPIRWHNDRCRGGRGGRGLVRDGLGSGQTVEVQAPRSAAKAGRVSCAEHVAVTLIRGAVIGCAEGGAAPTFLCYSCMRKGRAFPGICATHRIRHPCMCSRNRKQHKSPASWHCRLVLCSEHVALAPSRCSIPCTGSYRP